MANEPADDAELDGMTKAELLSYAAENDIGGVNSSMKKAEIIETIKEKGAST